MKRIKYLAGVVLTMCLVYGLSIAAFANPAYKTVNARNVENISITPKEFDYSEKIEDYSENFELYYSFTLEKPAYVDIYGWADGDGMPWVHYNISRSPDMSSYIRSYDDYQFSGGSDCYMALEAGTYYLCFDQKDHQGNKSRDKDDFFRFSIFKQDIERTGNTLANTKDTAIVIENGQTVVTAGTLFNPNQIAKFNVKNKAKVKLNAEVILPAYTNMDVSINVMNAKGRSVASNYIGQGDAWETEVMLEKGTYYVEIKFGTVYKDSPRGQVELTVNYKQTLKSPVLKSYKKNSKKVTGTAKEGSLVVVKVNKKTYKAAVKNGKYTVKLKKKLEKGDTITAYVTDKIGNKSNVVKKKVK